MNGEDIEPIKEVRAKGSRIDGGCQIPVRRGDDSDVRRYNTAAPDSFKSPFLDHSQQSDLCLLRKLSDLVEKNRSGVDYQVFAGTDKSFANSVPLRRHSTPDEVAGIVCFLLSDDSRYATGTTHSVDGDFITA